METKEHVHPMGWIRDSKDERDFQYSAIQKVPALPSETNLQSLFPSVYDQGNLGSCVGQATKGIMSAAYTKQGLVDPILSALMIYYNARELEGTPEEDTGCSPRDALKCAAKQGVCTEELWPYFIDKFAIKPPAECYADALNHQIINYYSVLPMLDSIKACLAEGYPLSGGIVVYENYPRMSGDFPMPQGQDVGGHDIVLVGYNDTTRKIIIRNSWGQGWGNDGYGTLPYEYITPELIGDLWTIRMIETPNTVPSNQNGCIAAILKLFGLSS